MWFWSDRCSGGGVSGVVVEGWCGEEELAVRGQ